MLNVGAECWWWLEKMNWSPLVLTVSILSLLSEGRLGFSRQSFRDIQRLQIESSVNTKNYQFSIRSPNICVEQIKD